MTTCAERINLALKLRNMKKSTLAEKAHISKSMVSEYCAGNYLPKQKNIYAMSKVLGVSEAWLMGIIDDMEPHKVTDRIFEDAENNDLLTSIYSKCEESAMFKKCCAKLLKKSDADLQRVLTMLDVL